MNLNISKISNKHNAIQCDAMILRVSGAMPMLSANGPRWHHRRRAGTRRLEENCDRRPSCAARRANARDLLICGVTAATLDKRSDTARRRAPRRRQVCTKCVQYGMHRDAPAAVKARESRCSHRASLKRCALNGYMDRPYALADFAKGGRTSSCFSPLWAGVSTLSG